MAEKESLRVGQRVSVRRSHDRNVTFTGTISAISDEAGVTVKTDATKTDVAHFESTTAADVTVIADAAQAATPAATASAVRNPIR
jgi:hypothetical protein